MDQYVFLILNYFSIMEFDNFGPSLFVWFTFPGYNFIFTPKIHMPINLESMIITCLLMLSFL